MKSLKTLLAVLVLVGASLASAEDDTFFLGNGQDGNVTVESAIVYPNSYTKVTAHISDNPKSISVQSTNGFKDGQLIMVLQLKGTELGSGTSVELESSAGGKVGRWEFARLASPAVTSGKLSLKEPLNNSYDKDWTQVITVPEYESLYIPSGKIVSAKYWDGFTGGVLVFLVRGTLHNEGKISANEVVTAIPNGVGFRGGSSSLGSSVTCDLSPFPGKRGEGLQEGDFDNAVRDNSANAGGGGRCGLAGGGGGGNATKGGNGGHDTNALYYGGLGGVPANYNEVPFPTRLVLGGGGGSGSGVHGGAGGAGGAGGGVIFIRTGSLLGNGPITANGVKGKDSTDGGGGGGGGGAGGTIILRVAGDADCPNPLSAKGGDGGKISSNVSAGPGGGGGSGRIFFQANDLSTCSADFSPGAPGHKGTTTSDNRGATAGGTRTAPDPIISKALAHPGDAVVTSVSPMQGGFVNVDTPTVKVRALAGRRVYLSFNGGNRTAPLSESSSPHAGYSEYTYKDIAVGNLKQDTNTVVAFAEYEGLWSKGVPSSFDVDTIAPNTHIAKVLPEFTPPTTNSRWVQFTFRATKSDTSTTVESGATFECSLDGSAWSPCGEVTTYDDTLGDATTHTLQVRAIDPAGNKDGVPASFSWTFDWTPPGKAIVTAPSSSPAFLKDQRYIFRGTMESDTDVLVYIDDVPQPGTANKDNSMTWSFRPANDLSAGVQHRLRVAARDSAGNVGPLSDTVFFSVDITPPTVTIKEPAAALLNTSLLLVKGTSEAKSTVTVTIWKKDGSSETKIENAGGSVPTGAGGIPEAWAYGMTMTLDDGTYVVKASAVDAAGNTSENPARHEFTLDRKPPNTKIIGCPELFTNQNTESFSFGSDASDVSGYECALVGNSQTTPMTQCPAELVKTPTDPGAPSYPDGEYELIARAKDYAGNVDPLPVACSWVWDQTPPDSLNLVVDGKSSPPPKVTNSELAVFYFTANDEHSGPVKYECLVEDVNPPGPVKSFGDCSNPYAVSVEKGTHRLKVRVMDQAGNLYEPPSGAVLPYEWTVDTGLPVARILPGKGAGDPTNAEEATFRFDLKVPISSGPVEYYYTLDPTIRSSAQAVSVGPDGDTVTITLPKEDGSYTLWALARDSRGIETPYELWDAYEWVVDRTAPKVEIVSKPKGQESSSTATFVFSAPEEEAVGGFLCILNDCSSVGDSTQAQNCTGRKDGASASFTVHGLQAGSNCIQVWSQDLAGNLSMSSASYRWTIASQSPASVVGGGVGCTSSGSGGSLLALLGLVRLLYRGRERRRA